MKQPDFYTGPEVAAILGQPLAFTDLPNEMVRVSRAGIVAVAPNLTDAIAAWVGEFVEMIRRPKARGEN